MTPLIHHGWGQKGKDHPFAKLTEKDVVRILELLSTKTRGEIAEEYGVSAEAIRAIDTGRSWKHVTQGRDVAKKDDEQTA